jgi:hypothetical protein
MEPGGARWCNSGVARLLTVVAALAASLAPPLAFAVAAESSVASKGARPCPVTLPEKGRVPKEVARFGGAEFDYGNANLRVILWPHGTLIAGRLPDGGSMAAINRDGSISAKLAWWRGQSAKLVGHKLVVTGRRLDASAGRLRADVPNGYGSLGVQPTGPIFPTVGCWHVTGKQGLVTLTFIVNVTKVRARAG